MNDNWFDLGQRLDEQWVKRAHRIREQQNCAKVEGIDAAHHRAHLTGSPAQNFPGCYPLGRLRGMLAIGAFGASRRAGGAISLAPAEMPLGKGDQAFFSASRTRAGAT